MKRIVWFVWIPILAAVLLGVALMPFGQLLEFTLANRSGSFLTVVPTPTMPAIEAPQFSLFSSTSGITRLAQLHTVKDGDTLEMLELVHGTPMQEIVSFLGNGFPEMPPYELQPGQKIIIPNGKNLVVWQEPGPPVDPRKGRKSGGFYDGPLVTIGTGTFIWLVLPVIVTQPYWEGHPAIDLDTYNRQPVFASDSGTVIFSGMSTSGYGNLLIIDHGNGFWTYYGHNEANLVQEGQEYVSLHT